MLVNIQNNINNLKANRLFEFLVVSVIILAALLAGARTYDIDPRMMGFIEFLDFAVTIFFVVELSLRFIAEENKKQFFRSGWNIFDTVIVAVSLIPTSAADMALLGRLLRIFRVLRMISFIPELRMLLNSLMRALPQLGYIVLLMFIIFYIYAAIGSTFFASINGELWGDISISMLTLFGIMTFEGWTDIMSETMAQYPLSWFYYLSFIFLTSFAFLNMVIGIVVNVIEQENRAEKEALLDKPEPTMTELQLEIQELKAMLRERG